MVAAPGIDLKAKDQLLGFLFLATGTGVVVIGWSRADGFGKSWVPANVGN